MLSVVDEKVILVIVPVICVLCHIICIQHGIPKIFKCIGNSLLLHKIAVHIQIYFQVVS